MWKYILLCFVIVVSFLYAAPNLYGEDPAVQVSATRGAKVENQTFERVNSLLQENNITAKSSKLENGQILIRLSSSTDQLMARDIIKNELKHGFITALNLAPATPAWLSAIGATPLKLGLDLRGGVHFLMEVDMDEAVNKSQVQMVQDLRSELREQKIRFRGIREAKKYKCRYHTLC